MDKSDSSGPAAAETPLFTYNVTTSPSPLQTSAPDGPSTGRILIDVQAPAGGGAFCSQIAIMVPIGQDATSLSVDTPKPEVNTDKWTLASSAIRTARELGQSGDQQFALFTYLCNAPSDYTIDYSLFFTLQAEVNQAVGLTTLSIEETSGRSSEPSGFTPKDIDFPLAKIEFTLFVDSFVARNLGSGATAPATRFTAGLTNQVELSWDGNATSYTLFDGDGSPPVQLGGATSYTLPVGPTVDTTYVLVAELAQGSGSAAVGASESQFLYRTLTLTVANPQLAPSEVMSAGAVVAASLAARGAVSGIGVCPPGTVVSYFGNIGDPALFQPSGAGVVGSPLSGWQLCNGQNGAPDLRGCFIAGAGGSYSVGATGGADTVTLTEDQMPVHSHGGSTGSSAPFLNYPGVQYCTEGVTTGIMVNVQTDDPNGNRPNMLTTMGQPDIQVNSHSHGINADGGGNPHENRPPFFALAFLMLLPVYPDGTRLRDPGGTVYLMIDQQLRAIPSPSVFDAIFLNWDGLVQTSAAPYAIGPAIPSTIQLVHSPPSPAFYLLLDNVKRYISSPDVFGRWNFNPAKVNPLTPAQLSGTFEGPPLH